MTQSRFHELHKTVKKNLAGGHETDLFQTPPSALPMLDQYLNPDWTIWEPACGKGYIVNYFNSHPEVRPMSASPRCWGTDFLMGPEYDFFTTDVHTQHSWDCIVTNPPWSLKIEWAYRCLELGKPFALLVPITFLEGSGTRLVDNEGMELIVPYQRIAFETPHEGWWGHYGKNEDNESCRYIDLDKFWVCPKCGGEQNIRQIKSSPQKKSMWVTWGLNIGRQVVYYDLKEDRARFNENNK